MKIFVVNLAQSTDRKAYMEKVCTSMGLSIELIPAVYGKNLTISEIERLTDQNKANKEIGRDLLLGEIGCALSHKKIYQKMINEDISEALILEDDIYFEPFFKQALEIARTKRPKNSDLVLLGHHSGAGEASLKSVWGNKQVNDEFMFYRLADFGFGTYGYYLTLVGAKKLLKSLDKIYQPIDHYTCSSQILNVYALEPIPIKFKIDEGSLIDIERKRIEKKSLVKTTLHQIGLFPLVSLLNKYRKKIKPIRRYK